VTTQLVNEINIMEKMNGAMFMWDIPDFDITKPSYVSSDLYAFGHTLVLTVGQGSDNYYCMFLHMRSRVSNKLVYKSIVLLF
jgi:hypothetical protein